MNVFADVERICHEQRLGKLLAQPILLPTGFMHSVWKVTTSHGQFAIKVLNRSNQLLNDNLLTTQQSSEIAGQMQAQGISTVLPLSLVTNSDSSENITIYPWIHGQTIEWPNVTTTMAEKIGVVVGRIHQANCQLSGIKSPTWIGLQEAQWQQLLHSISAYKTTALFLQQWLPQLIEWSHLASKASQQSSNYIFSHRDFDLKNVIWQDNQPILLDWEYAGWINPKLDLLIVALNWSGVQYGDFVPENFEAVVRGFTSITAQSIEFDDSIFHLYFGYCLDWLLFVCQQMVEMGVEKNSAEVMSTIKAIDFVGKNVTGLQGIASFS